MARILILEDSPMDQRVLRSVLGRHHELQFVETAEALVAAAVEFRPELVLLDVILPQGSGFGAYAALRKDPRFAHTPVFFVSGKNSPGDKVAGLSLGADDYVGKPFDPEELRVRVDNRLRKTATLSNEGQILERGLLRIDVAAQSVHVEVEAKLVPLVLTPLEYRLLLFLVRHEGGVHSRKSLIEKVWGTQNVHVTERNVDTQIKGLRQKCVGCEHYFVSVYGEGYRFESAAKVRKSA